MHSASQNLRHQLFGRVSRREAIAGAALSPSAGRLNRQKADTDPTIAACQKWLAMDARRRRLQLAWSDHEAWLAETCGWLRLSAAERAAVPEGVKLAEIDAQLDVLEAASQALLDALPLQPAGSVTAVIANLSVADSLLGDEHRPEIRGLVLRAIRDLSTLSAQE